MHSWILSLGNFSSSRQIRLNLSCRNALSTCSRNSWPSSRQNHWIQVRRDWGCCERSYCCCYCSLSEFYCWIKSYYWVCSSGSDIWFMSKQPAFNPMAWPGGPRPFISSAGIPSSALGCPYGGVPTMWPKGLFIYACFRCSFNNLSASTGSIPLLPAIASAYMAIISCSYSDLLFMFY